MCTVQYDTDNKHVLNNCALDRYKVRHDAVLRMICVWLQSINVGETVLHADFPGSDNKPLDVLFKNICPAIAIVQNNAIHLLELTTCMPVCHETNMIKSRDYKLRKYAAIHDDCKDDYRSHSIIIIIIINRPIYIAP